MPISPIQSTIIRQLHPFLGCQSPYVSEEAYDVLDALLAAILTCRRQFIGIGLTLISYSHYATPKELAN